MATFIFPGQMNMQLWRASSAAVRSTANSARPAYRCLSSSSRHLSATHNAAPARIIRGTLGSRTLPSSSRNAENALPLVGRSFSTSGQRQKAILNPRVDEEGNEMDVEITPRAANRLKQIMTTESNPDLALRVSVESGGCHGFQYLMSLTDMAKVSQEEDTVFEGRDNTKVVMDEPSLELLKGSKVDYTMELIGSQFKIVDNPLATSSCGCGTSFDIKV